jgi:hypothetical protein
MGHAARQARGGASSDLVWLNVDRGSRRNRRDNAPQQGRVRVIAAVGECRLVVISYDFSGICSALQQISRCTAAIGSQADRPLL